MDAQQFADMAVSWINANYSDEVVVDYQDAFNRLTFGLGLLSGIREGAGLYDCGAELLDVDGECE